MKFLRLGPVGFSLDSGAHRPTVHLVHEHFDLPNFTGVALRLGRAKTETRAMVVGFRKPFNPVPCAVCGYTTKGVS